MSNCLKIPAIEIAIPLELLTAPIPETREPKGYNRGYSVFFDKEEQVSVWTPATFTTWRELRCFIMNFITPFIKPEHLGKIFSSIKDVRDESDAFDEHFTLRIRYTTDWEQIYK